MYKRAIDVKEPAHWATRPISGTLGRLMGTLSLGPTLGLPGASWRRWTPERIEEVKKIVKEYEKLVELEDRGNLDLGGVRPFRQLGRIWKRPDLSVLGKLYGTATLPVLAAYTSLLRADHYSPFSDTATVFNVAPQQAMARHELGHMSDFARRRLKTLYMALYGVPFANLYHEYQASRIASDVADKSRTSDDKVVSKKPEPTKLSKSDIKQLKKYLAAAYGTYIGTNLAPVIGPVSSVVPWMARSHGSDLFPATGTDNRMEELLASVQEQQKRINEMGPVRRSIGL